MTDSLATYYRVVMRFTELVDSISADQWSSNTPCEGWTVRDLMQHIIVRDRKIAASLGDARADEPAPDADLATAWHERVAWWAAGLADPALAEAVWQTASGELTFREAAIAMMTGELTIHTWDLARALGVDDTLDPEGVRMAYAQLQGYDEQKRGPQTMGPEVEVPIGTDEQTRLIAFTGRSV